MAPLTGPCGLRAPLLVVACAWLVFGSVRSAADAPGASLASGSAARSNDGDAGLAMEPPVTALTQETRDARAQYRAMRRAAAENGSAGPASSVQPPASQPAGQAPATQPADRAPRSGRANLEEARRRALESRAQRQAEARQRGHEAASQPGREEGMRRFRSPIRERVEPAPGAGAPPYGATYWDVEAQGEAAPPDTQAAQETGEGGAAAARQAAGEAEPPGTAEVAEPPPPSPDGRDYFISFVNMPWEDVIRHYAKLVGKPLMGDFTVGGQLTYESKRRFTKEEMRDELNFLLLEQGQFIVEKEDYIYVVPDSELSKELGLDRMFDSLEAFERANLRDLEICSVLIQIKDRPAEQIRDMLSPSMPERAAPVVVGDTNKIKITGLAQDVRRFVGLLEVVKAQRFDPRVTRFIKVETNVREIERMLRDFLALQQPTRRYNPQTRQFETVGGESDIVIIADERTKNLIVRATQDKLAEIESFVKDIDQKPDIGEFKTTVIPVRYGNATEIARLLNDILQQEQGQARGLFRQPTQRFTRGQPPGRQPTPSQPQPQPTPEDIIVEDLYERAKKTVRIVADERTNNLVVYANEDGLKRVNEILQQIDQPVPSNFRTFRLANAEATQIQPTIEQIARSIAATGGGPAGRAPTVLADQALNALHVLAEREQMTRIEEIIRELDLAAPEDEWHFVELVNISASSAAQIIAPFLDGTAGPQRQAPRGRRAAGGVAPTARTIPLDAASTLIVICSAEEWQKVEQVLKLADEKAISNRPEVQFFPVAHGDPLSIANTLNQLYRNYQHPVLGRVPVYVDTVGDQVVVQGVKPALEEIATLIEALDVRVAGNPLVILPLVNADAVQVAQQVQPLLTAATGGRPGPRGGVTSSVQADPATNSLIVQADEATLERIKSYVRDYEARVAGQTPERLFITPRNAAPRDVVNAVNALFGSAVRGVRGGASASQVKAVEVGPKVLIEAPREKLGEIRAMIAQLEEEGESEIIIKTVKMPGADVAAIANRLTAAFGARARRQDIVARFDADPSSETILLTCSRSVQEEADKLLAEYAEAYKPLITEIKFRQLNHANAADAANWLREQLVAAISKQYGRGAAEQVKVTADTRTNKVIINAPQVAVTQGMQLLEQYDVPLEVAEQPPPPVVTDAVKLPGQNVANLASQLTQAFRNRPPRPDKLQYTFGYDQITETLIYTVPKDGVPEVQELIAKFAAQSEELIAAERIYEITNAEAGYIAEQLRNLLTTRIRGTRGQDVASRVNIAVDARLNRVILNAPKLALELADAYVKELDQVAPGAQIQLIQLENVDGNTVVGILNQMYADKIRTQRTLRIGVEPLTNSVIVSGSQKDFEEIQACVRDLDTRAMSAVSQPRFYEFKNANPWEALNVLNTVFTPRSPGRRVQPGKEIVFNVIGGRALVYQAPPEKLADVEALLAKLDEIGSNQLQVRTYELPGMGSRLTDLARQLEQAVNQQVQAREQRVQRISITAYPPADALIVTALEAQFAQVEELMAQFKPLMEVAKSKTEFFTLQYVDAAQIVATVKSMVQARLTAEGRGSRGMQDFSVLADARTNRLIVFAPESTLPDVRAVVTELDVPVETEDVVTIELQYADPGEIARMINEMFGARRGPVAESQQVRVTVSNNTLVVQAPPNRLQDIRELVAKVDAENPDRLQIKMYDLKVLNATQVAVQVQMFLRSMQTVTKRGEMQPGAFAEPTTNTLVVIAPGDQIPFIDTLIAQIEAKEPDAAVVRAYALQNARADEVQRHVDQMLRAKIAEREGSTKSQSVQQRTAVMADPAGNRLFVFAPAEYQDLAVELVRMIDEEVESGEIVHIIPLENGDATQVAQTVTQTMQDAGPRGRVTAPPRVTVVADAGSNSILLCGLPKDVAEIEKLVKDLEAASDTVPELQYFTLKHAMSYQVAEALRGIFPATRNVAESVAVTEDEYSNRLLVTANRRKMRQVEAVIAQLDVPAEEEGAGLLAGGKDIYFVSVARGDAFDIAWEVSDLFPPPDRGGPDIEADLFGEYIRVICRPSEFARIERVIREFDSRAKPEIVLRAIDFAGGGGRLERLLQYLRAREFDVQIEAPPAGEEVESIIIDLHPEGEEKQRTSADKPRAQAAPRGAAPYFAGGVILSAVVGLQVEDSRQDEPVGEPTADDRRSAEPQPPRREAPSIQVVGDGRILLRGLKDAVDELEEAIDLFQEDLSLGEVIRIFRFRYGDVNAASRILDLMFNEPRARIQLPRQPQQPGQQPGQPQRGERGRGEGEEREQPGGLMQQIQQMIGGRAGAEAGREVGGQRIRIATDASHNYLIVKCDESLLPEVTRLLRELDIRPAEVDVRVFQLKNIEAGEAANNLKELLGITKARTARPQLPQVRGGSPQQLLEILQQQMVSIAGGVEGSAKIENVEIVPNAITNSLLVSAPPDVMTIVENIISKMEALEGGDITVIRHYPLTQARVDDVLPLLQDIFSAAGGGGGGRRGAGGSPADLGPVTISGDPRNNTIIFVAQAKDVETVEEQIRRLDIQGAVAEVQMYVCQYGDAVSIAQAVSDMFVEGPAGGGRRGARGGAPQPANLEVRITAEPATNTILVFAPEDKRALILAQIEQLDRQNRFDIREIPIALARPESVADKLLQIFGGTGGSALTGAPGGGRRGGARAQVAQTPGRIVIVPDENGKRLLVRAPDETFARMKEIAELLDQPSEQLLVRIFTLKHADAEVVVESVRNALAEFIQMQRMTGGGEQLDLDAFTAVADPRTNSVVVVGSEQTFLFVQQLVSAVDVPTQPDQMKQFRIFVLDRAPADVVAEAINAFAAGRGGAGAGRRPGRGVMPAGGGAGTGAVLDVQAIADATTNSVMVYGRPEDIALIEQAVIEEYEGSLSGRNKFATIQVREAMPTQVIAVIQPFLDRMSGQAEGRGGARGGAAAPAGPQLIGNDNAGTIEVYGSERQIEEVRTLVARFDSKDMMLNQWEIIEIPWGQDALALADLVQNLVNSSEQESAQRAGRQPRLVSVMAEEQSNAVIAFGDSAQLAVVKTVLDQLTAISPQKPVTRIIELTNLSSAEAEQLINDLQQRRGGSRTGTSGLRSTPGRRTTTPPRTTPQRSTPRRTTPSGRSSGRTGGAGRGSWNWNPAWDGPRLSLVPAGPASPLLGTNVISPGVSALLLAQATGRQPATQRSAGVPAPAGAAPPGAARQDEQRREAPAAPPTAPRAAEQQALLQSISGQLRGEVIATPLDSRRIIVTGDEEDVQFIVEMLALMERTTPEPVIEVFTLEHTKAAAIAPLLQEMMRALIEARGGGDRVDAFSIIAEARSNSLIVSASEPNMEIIAEIIGKLDLETLKPTQTKLVPLRHIRAAEALSLLQDAVKRLNDMREVPAAAQAALQAVERSNAILVVGTPADIAEIERLIEGIDVDLPKDQDFTTARILIVDLKNAQADDLAETLNEIIAMERATTGGAGGGGRGVSRMPLLRRLILTTAEGRELPALDLDKPIVIFSERGKNSLIIFSSEKNAEALLEIVGLFDQLPTGEEVEVKSFALKYGNAEKVADLLNRMFEDAKKAIKRPSEGAGAGLEQGRMPAVPPGLAGRGLPYNVVVTHDVRSNTVIVIGRKDAVLLAAGLINELDVPSADFDIRPYVLQLKNVQATTLQEKLQELLEERLRALGDDQNVARDSAVLTADDRSNALIVLATPEVYAMVEDLALQLDRAEPYSVVDSEFRRLEYADAAKLAGLLQELFDKKKDADQDVTEGGQKNVLFVFADARSNSLMLTGTRDYLLEANRLVDHLDQAFDPTVQFRLRPVRLNSAANIASLLTEMIEQSRRDQAREMQGTPIYVGADPYSNSLLLAASAEDMLMLERWIEVLDRPAEPGRMTRIIPLLRGSAQELAQSAQELYRTQARGAEADVTVTHDPTTNAIIAIGPPAVVADIEDLVTRLNAVEGAGAVLKIFHLEQADAEDAGELLRSILEGRGGSVGGGTRGGGGSQEEFNQVMLIFQREHPEVGIETLKGMRTEVRVIDDIRTNSLVITAPPETMPLMESLVAAIDIPPQAAKIRVFKLYNSDAEDMVERLRELFEQETVAGQRAGAGEGEEMQLTLGELGAGGRQRLVFTVDTRTNSVIAAGTTGYLDLVEELILQLDSQPIDQRKTLVYQPSNNQAAWIEQALTAYSDAEEARLEEIGDELSVFEKQRRIIKAIASEDINRVILDYDPRREGDVLELVRQLDQPPPQVMIQVLIVEVTMDNSLELGVEFAFQDLQWTKAGPSDTTTFDYVGGTDIGAAGTGLGGFTFTITGADFNFLIRTLQSEGSLNVLSRPQIVAMDNQEANIKITNDVPYAAGSTVTATGIVQTTVNRREVGIELTVTPHINPDGFVRMEIEQTVSDITGSTVNIGEGLTSPIFLDRTATTTVTVRDNETVVLGGLITTRDEVREQKVPLIGDIPILGRLFSNEKTETKHTELLVILTPRVVRTVEDYRELSLAERDRTGAIPPQVLSNELMNGLRVRPEDLPPEGKERLGPSPGQEQPEEYDRDVYGPIRSSLEPAPAEPEPAADPESYDVPLSRAGARPTGVSVAARQAR